MKYQIFEIHSGEVTDNIKNKIINFCQKAISENKHAAAQNMQVDNWQTNEASLLYLLMIEERFKKNKGGLHLLMDNEVVIAVSGYYQSDFDKGVYLMGVRSWVLKEYRFKFLLAKHLLPRQIDEIKKRGAHTAALTFNDSTQSFAKLIARSNKNPEARVKFFFGDSYPELYRDMTMWHSPVKIKGVKQWILIKKLSESDFDWNSLNWAE